MNNEIRHLLLRQFEQPMFSEFCIATVAIHCELAGLNGLQLVKFSGKMHNPDGNPYAKL
jgi:hypothetical protein